MRISVVVTGFNVAAYIEQALASLAAQVLPPWEVIFVDDGSGDDTVARALPLLQAWPRWQLVRQNNRGPGGARNAGLALARGAFVTFVDGDDWLLPEALSRLAAAAAAVETEGDTVDAVFANLQRFDEASGRLSTQLVYERDGSAAVGPGRGLLRRFAVTGKLFRLEMLTGQRLSFPEGVVWEDYPFSYAVLGCARRIAVTTEPVYVFRRRASHGPVSASRGDRLSPFYLASRAAQILACRDMVARYGLDRRFPGHDFAGRDVNYRLIVDLRRLLDATDEAQCLAAMDFYRALFAAQPWIPAAASPATGRVLQAVIDGDLVRVRVELAQLG